MPSPDPLLSTLEMTLVLKAVDSNCPLLFDLHGLPASITLVKLSNALDYPFSLSIGQYAPDIPVFLPHVLTYKWRHYTLLAFFGAVGRINP